MRARPRHRWYPAVATAFCATLVVGTAEAEPPAELGRWSNRASVEIVGERTGSALTPAFLLHVRFEAGVASSPYQALLVYAEPEHRLLFAQFDDASAPPASLREAVEGQGALAALSGSLAKIDVRVALPYEPMVVGPDRIEVKLVWEGKAVTVASAAVDPRSFQFLTTFQQGPRGSHAVVKAEHCCTSQRCGQICTNCNGPFFFCDMIECTIDCIDF